MFSSQKYVSGSGKQYKIHNMHLMCLSCWWLWSIELFPMCFFAVISQRDTKKEMQRTPHPPAPFPTLPCMMNNAITMSPSQSVWPLKNLRNCHVAQLCGLEWFSPLSPLEQALPRSMETQGFFWAGAGWYSRDGGENGVSAMGKLAAEEVKLSMQSVGGSSLMLLSVVQGDQRGEATAEEFSLLRKRASRRSPVSAKLRVCQETSGTFVNRSSNEDDRLTCFGH